MKLNRINKGINAPSSSLILRENKKVLIPVVKSPIQKIGTRIPKEERILTNLMSYILYDIKLTKQFFIIFFEIF